MSRLTAAVAAFVLAAAPAAAQAPAPAGPEALVAADATPGTTALLVEHATRADVQVHLARLLMHPRADVRGAAARVILAVGIRGLLPGLTDALQAEVARDTYAELARAVATLGGPAADDAIVASWARLGPDAAAGAVAYAHVRGAAALGALPAIRALPARAVSAFVEAARPDAAAIDALLARSAAAGDVVVFEAAAAAAKAARVQPADARLAEGLAADRPAELRLAAARATLGAWTGEAPLAPALVAGMNLDAPLGDEADGIDTAVIRELAARAAGRRAAPGAVWRAQVDEPGGLLAGLLRSKGVQDLLTPAERRALRRALPNGGRGEPPGPLPPGPGRIAVQLLDSYPRGFVPGVIAATGCDLAKARRQGLGAGAGELVLRRDGRAASIAPLDTGATDAGCIQATRVLLMTHVVDAPPTADNERRVAVVPFEDEYLACRESAGDGLDGGRLTGAARVTPPKKTRHVNPIFPETAQRAGIQGLVVLDATVGGNGCVHRLRVLRGLDPRLDLAALMAVMRWRFSPALVDGRPTPVILTVTVQFSLQ